MQIVTIGGTVYLGTLETTEEGHVLKSSLCLGAVSAVTKRDLANFIKAGKVGQLSEDIEITGNGATFSKRNLPADLVLELKILEMRMEQATGLAVPELINDKFTKLVG